MNWEVGLWMAALIAAILLPILLGELFYRAMERDRRRK